MDDLQLFHHAALTVSDCDRSADWYQAVLGFEVLFREEGDERRAAIMRFASGASSVGLVEHASSDDRAFAPHRIGLDHLAFAVASRADLDGWAGRLTEHGVVHSGVIEIPVGAILNFSDPDGIALALFWDSPGTS